MNRYIWDVVHTFMNKSIWVTPTYASFEQANVKSIQQRCLFTDVWATLNTYRHDVKRGNLAFWLFQTLRYVWFNSKYLENQPS